MTRTIDVHIGASLAKCCIKWFQNTVVLYRSKQLLTLGGAFCYSALYKGALGLSDGISRFQLNEEESRLPGQNTKMGNG